MRHLLQRLKFAGIIAALSVAMGACATSPPKQLEDARSTYQQAQQSNAAQYAPAELAEARKALVRAEQAFEQEGDEDVTRTLAYIALRQAQQAMTQGQVNYLVTAREAKQQQLVQRGEQVREQYQRELIRQRQLNEMTSQQLEQQRERLEEQRERFEQQRQQRVERMEAQDQTRDQIRQQEDQLRQRERDYEQAIQRLEVEIERREQAEDQLEQALSQLEDIASVRQEDGRGQVITLEGSVLFEHGESELLPNARQRLQEVANVLKMQDNGTFTIEGHTDSTGSAEFNEGLSRERAQSVKDYLVSRGVESNRIEIVGRGENNPIASNNDPEGRAMNRRVEIVLPTDTAVGGGPNQQQNQQQDQQNQQNQQQNQQNEGQIQQNPPSERDMMQPDQPAEPQEDQDRFEEQPGQEQDTLEDEPSPMDETSPMDEASPDEANPAEEPIE